MASVVKLGLPRNVSPFIRFCRWSLLLTGVAYGHYRYNYLAKREVGIQERENKIRERRDARLAKEREHRNKLEMDDLGREAGVIKTPAPASNH